MNALGDLAYGPSLITEPHPLSTPGGEQCRATLSESSHLRCSALCRADALEVFICELVWRDLEDHIPACVEDMSTDIE